MSGGEWESAHLWRVGYYDYVGDWHVWCETSDKGEAEMSLLNCPGQFPLFEELYKKTEFEWRSL